jgi:hypothetical protein
MALYHGIKIARASDYHGFFCYFDSKTMLDLVTKGTIIATAMPL